ncbi:iron-containing alcohol dehydrogenase [Algivirga pacifica]|uniref:Iron-containing alcohol dehydrogenase n=1 Tax=Algivirga pacifica TaxID=1162670 RepID=A0ABP9DFQ4_9BACT
MLQRYSFPTNILFGEGAIRELPQYLIAHSLEKPLIVTDPVVIQLPFFQDIIADLKKYDIRVTVFDQLHKNPLKSDVLNGKEAYKHSNCIIGLGGGVAMDTARAIALSIHHQEDLFYYDDLEGGSKCITHPIPPLITIPTTAGTGSEVGRSAIISEDESKRKRILFHPRLMAQQVFADPALTYDLPASITTATGMDALTHHIEAFLSKGFHPMADGIALEGIRLIFSSLENCVKKPTPEDRGNMMIASLMGAVAFQKGLGLVHSLAHPLSTLLDMHHGLANAIMLPYGLSFNYEGLEEKFERMATASGVNGLRGEGFIDAILQLNQTLDIPSLSDEGVKEIHIPQLTELCLKDFCLPSNPKSIREEEVKAIYEQALAKRVEPLNR